MVGQNLLDRQFTMPTPNRGWVTDITYVWTPEGWLYLAVILDLFSRRVVGWSLSERLERGIALTALELSGISCLSQWLNERSSCVKQLLIAL